MSELSKYESIEEEFQSVRTEKSTKINKKTRHAWIFLNILGRPINSCRFYIGKLKFVCDCCLNNSINKFDINRKRIF